MKTTISLLTLTITLVLFTPNASAKPAAKNFVLITYQVIEDGQAIECDPTTKLDIGGKTYDIECNGDDDVNDKSKFNVGFGGTFLVQIKPGKHTFRIWNVYEAETEFDRVIKKRPSWYVQNVTIDVVNGVVTVTSSNL